MSETTEHQHPTTTIVIDVTIIKGRNLISEDTNLLTSEKKSCDFNPYVELHFRDRKYGRTRITEKTICPTWNKRFKITIDAEESSHIQGHTDSTSLSLRIFDKGRLKNDAFMGESVVPLSLTEPLTKPPKKSWYPVGTGSGKLYYKNAKGEIQVKVSVSEVRHIVHGNTYTLPCSCIEVSLHWTIDAGQRNDLDNSCVAIDSHGSVLMDESVYFGHLVNSNGSISHSGDVLDGGKYETILCNLNSIPLHVDALYFILTVATPGKTLKDTRNAFVNVIDTNTGAPLCQCSPTISGERTSMLLMRITRSSKNWEVSLIEDMNNTAKELGALVPKVNVVDNIQNSFRHIPGRQSVVLSDPEIGVLSTHEQIEAMGLQINSMEQRMNEMRSLVNKSEVWADESINQQKSVYTLENDTFNLMMLSKPFSITWFFSLWVFIFQIILVTLILFKQLDGPIAIPFTVSQSVTIGQFFAIISSVVTQPDIFDSIKTAVVMWNQEEKEWAEVFKTPVDTISRRRKIFQVLFPTLFKFGGGILVLLTSFIIIINSDDIIDLFTNFAAMHIISFIDNAFFVLAEQGYFGRTICKGAKEAKDVQVQDNFPLICKNVLPLQSIITIILLGGMVVGWSFIVIEQQKGEIFKREYPNCAIAVDQLSRVGDGTCDGGVFNTVQCNFDGGDCVITNLAFPKCKVDKPSLIGDGTCQDEMNIEDCGFDGGDCCPYDESDPLLGDGKCHGLWYNTYQCGWDGGDCVKFNKDHPKCFVDLLHTSSNTHPVVIGDGICSGGNTYRSEACGYESGDCSETTNYPSITPSAHPTNIMSTVPTATKLIRPSNYIEWDGTANNKTVNINDKFDKFVIKNKTATLAAANKTATLAAVNKTVSTDNISSYNDRANHNLFQKGSESLSEASNEEPQD